MHLLPGTISRSFESVILSMNMGNNLRGTLVIISPSEKHVVRIPVSGLLGAILLLIITISGFTFFTLRGPTSQVLQEVSSIQGQSLTIAANLDSVTEEIRELLKVNTLFSRELEKTLLTLQPATMSSQGVPDLNVGFADPAQVFGVAGHTARLQTDVITLSQSFQTAAPAVEQVRATLETQRDILRKLPTFWPVVGGRMGLTMEFGPRIHPFTGQWYIHKGADIASAAGTPIVAAADGVVVRSEFDTRSGYGNMVVLEHAFGFTTLYAHMRDRRVQVGQRINQGQLLGTMGATGVATGVHLHYEIKIGEEVMDPTTYLAIRNNFYRWESLTN